MTGSPDAGPPVSVAVVVSGWPRLSETFALNELLTLEDRGILGGLFATKSGDTSLVQPDVDRLNARLHHLGAGTAEQQARELARLIADGPSTVTAIHGYFAHRPAEVAEGAARRLGLPFSFSVHALDARKVSEAELARRCRAASLVTTCNADVTAVLRRLGAEPVELPHGVDLHRFRPTTVNHGPVLEILAVGRLVEKKGFVHLIDAMARVDRPVRLRIIGDGPDHGLLAGRIERLGLASSVELVGRRTHAQLPAEYRSAHLVVVPSVVDGRGDRDGLPNVVLEAMASGRPVVASRVAAVPTVVDASTGVLVDPGDPAVLAQAINALAADPERRRRLGAEAAARVASRFGLDRCSGAWADLLTSTHQPLPLSGGRHG